MKKLLATTAVAILAAGPMFAQTTPAPAPAETATAGTSAGFIQANQPNDIFGSDLIGMTVYSSEENYTDQPYNAEARANWNDIGDVNDILLDSEGKVKAVLVDVGGFLGMGEHTIALDMGQVHMLRDDAGDRFVAVNFSEDQLKSAPEFERTGDTMSTSGNAGNGMAPGAGTMAPGADATTADNTMMPAASRPAMERDGYADVDYATLTADDLKGATVYDVNDEAIGDISELVLDPSGKIEQAVLDVGGFLGMGAHTVALPFNEMQIMRQGDGGDIRVYVDESKDSLEQRPSYQG